MTDRDAESYDRAMKIAIRVAIHLMGAFGFAVVAMIAAGWLL